MRCVHAISLCLGFPCPLIHLLWSHLHPVWILQFISLPSSSCNACVRAGFSLQLWAVLAFKDFPSRQSVLMHYYYFLNDAHYFLVFLDIYFGILLEPEAPVVWICRHFHVSHPAILMKKRGFTGYTTEHFVIRPWIPLDIKMQETCLGDCLW